VKLRAARLHGCPFRDPSAGDLELLRELVLSANHAHGRGGNAIYGCQDAKMAHVDAGKQARQNRPVEKAGVRAVQAIFEDANLIFQAVDLGNDIGKDAYVDLAEGGLFKGVVVALQIKGGESFRRGDDYKVPCNEDDLALWAGSSIPIYGMVHDPTADSVHWADLTGWSKSLAPGEHRSYCPVPRQNLLSAETVSAWASFVRSQLHRQASPRVLDLMSNEVRRQVAAVSECFALGRSDPRPLMLLRACLRWLADVDASWPAIQILSFATPHPDVYWSADTWFPDDVKRALNATYRWDIDEAEFLIRAPSGDMWARGDLGESVYMLLAADPRCDQILEQLVAGTDDSEVRWQAARLRVARASEDALSTLELLVQSSPGLQEHELFSELRTTLLEHGHVSMW
jgi:hypothetical protein